MRSRSLLVVLSLLVFASGPAEATGKARNTRAKKLAAQKRAAAAAKRKAPAPEQTDEPGAPSLSDTRRQAAATDVPVPRPAAKRTPTATTTRARTSMDSSAAVAPRRRFVKVKRFFAGLAILGALSAGAVGWQAADMNGKVSDAYTYVSDTVSRIIWGGHDDPGTPHGPKSDPGPPLPVPDPQPDPGPSPKGGSGHQTPKGPETDRTIR